MHPFPLFFAYVRFTLLAIESKLVFFSVPFLALFSLSFFPHLQLPFVYHFFPERFLSFQPAPFICIARPGPNAPNLFFRFFLFSAISFCFLWVLFSFLVAPLWN